MKIGDVLYYSLIVIVVFLLLCAVFYIIGLFIKFLSKGIKFFDIYINNEKIKKQ